jgi:aerobic-type carbon monoxide dehydrogenase small subunit (CoxS/CutS family)
MDTQTSVRCEINGCPAVLTGDPASPALAALRAQGLLSVRETCGLGVCGTCTVLLDDEPVSACILPLYALEGRALRTTEGLAEGRQLSDLQEQFIASQAFQCSFCTPGFLMSGTALLESTDGPLDAQAVEDGLQGHLCRCGCYAAITEAVQACAGRRGAGGAGAGREAR